MQSKIKKQSKYKPKNNTGLVKLVIYDLDELIKTIPYHKLPKDKYKIEKFLHTIADDIFSEITIFLTREEGGYADKWVKNSKMFKSSDALIDNAIYSYYVIDSTYQNHWHINEIIDIICDFIEKEREMLLGRKIVKLSKKY